MGSAGKCSFMPDVTAKVGVRPISHNYLGICFNVILVPPGQAHVGDALSLTGFSSVSSRVILCSQVMEQIGAQRCLKKQNPGFFESLGRTRGAGAGDGGLSPAAPPVQMCCGSGNGLKKVCLIVTDLSFPQAT